ncbi:hypothetical protein EC973_004635 [Apophysomyces ossiformis]|uniref:Uncharacterized protein n=1 Tax=Apophysomyces ossiformis TaxID=679940 RepID=A0A8H7BL38_9FUNG|nr:hypothetical protein EC973_004635 [Apophysomyces ossiformis]
MSDQGSVEVHQHNGDIVNSVVGSNIGTDARVTINSQARPNPPSATSSQNHFYLVDLGETTHQTIWEVNNIPVALQFRKYQEAVLRGAKEQGLDMERHAQQLLALSHIMLLKPSQNDAKAVAIYGCDRLKATQRNYIEQFCKASEV